LGVKVAGINLAMMYNETGEPDKAMREAQKLTELYGPNIYADFTVAQSFHQKKQYGEAARLYLELLQKPLNSREFELAILKDAASAYQSLNDLDNAIYYLEKSYSLRDSLHNQQTEETIHNLKIAYETEKKEAKIATLEDEKRLMIWLGIVGGIVLLLALTTFFFLWRWTVQKKCLAQSQRELAEQQIKQLQQEKQLIATQAVLDGEIQERTRIARDLHDGLGSLLSAVSLHINEMNKNTALNSENTARFDKAMRMLDEAISEMRRIAHHLMPDALSRFGLKMALTDFCNSIPVAEFIYFGNERRLAPKMEELVYRIANELINNALKHSGASHILVQIVQEADRLALTVEDNGKGFNPEVITTGMGLANVRTRVASFGGTIDIRSSAGSGTEINIEFQL
jgi:signal transduction histidine kinase